MKDSTKSYVNKTLQHFQYTLFEESTDGLGYLIDLNKFHSDNPDISSGEIREHLTSSDFVKYTASDISISDCRNASEFVKMIKK